MKRLSALAVAVLFLVTLTSVAAATQTVASGDKSFVQKAAAGGMFEVEAGKPAARKASSEDVKKFGQRMVDDHQKANDELMKIAGDKAIKVGKTLDRGHKEKVDKLRKASGAKFDTEYMDMMVKDHETDVKEFQKEADQAKDPEVKAFAAKTLPILQEHLSMAKETQAKVKGGTPSKEAGTPSKEGGAPSKEGAGKSPAPAPSK